MKARQKRYEERLTVQGRDPTFNDDGVDLTQIRRALSLTPSERLALADQTAREIETIRLVARLKGASRGKR